MRGTRARHAVPLTLAVMLASVAALAEEPAASTHPPSFPCEGTVRQARVLGCDTARCRDPGFPDILVGLAGLRAGEVLDGGRVEAARARLLELGLFRGVTLRCAPGEGGLDVDLEVIPVTRLRKVRFLGHRHFDEPALLDRLPVEPGDPLDPQGRRTDDLLERVRDAVKRAYAEEGFHATDVDLVLKPVEGDLVDLHVTVREGERLKIARVEASLGSAQFAGDWTGPREWACPAVRARDLRSWAGVSAGDAYTDRTVPTAVQNLQRALRAIGFSGVRIVADLDRETRRLALGASYSSCYLIRFFVRDRDAPGRLGFRPLDDPGLLEVLPFADSGVFDLTEASLGREGIRQYFEDRGYLFADVVLDYRAFRAGEGDDRPEWVGPGVSGIISYFVTTNRRREVRSIRFPGRRDLDESHLREVMATRPYDFFGDPGAVLPDQVFQDLERIRERYRREGFPDIAFEWAGEEGVRRREVAREGRETVYTYVDGDRAFRVRTLPSTDGVVLEIGVREGDQQRLGEVRVQGVTAFPVDELMRDLDLLEGRPFSPLRLADAVRDLRRRYANEGYLAAEVRVACRGHDPDGADEACFALDGPPAIPHRPSRDRGPSRRVDVAITVVEGTRTRVLAVIVDGVQRTREDVVRREFPRPGEPYRLDRVAQAVRTLKNFGVFRSVQVQAVGAGEHPPREEVALVVTCREARSRFVDLAGGFETLNRSGEFPGYLTSPLATTLTVQDRTTTGFGRTVGLQIPDILLTAEVRYTDLNFLGRAKRLYLPVKYGISATAWDRYAAFTPTYVDPRFFARGLNFRVTPFVIYDRATTRLDLFQFGAEFALSKEVLPSLFGGLTYEIAEVTSRDPETETAYSPFRIENKVVPTLTYDRLDHPINPKRGGIIQASLSYINAIVSGNVRNYLKFEATAKGFYTVRNFLTFAFMGRYGTSRSFGASGILPQEERFTLGGNRGVRGFANDAIAQYHPDGSLRLERLPDGTLRKPYGGDIVVSGSTEVRFPVVRRINLFAAVFYDVGALADRVAEISGASFRHSVGFGVRYLLGDAIPIRLDYGLILDRRCRDVDPLTGLCVQKEEIGNIHFGLLYSF